MRHELKERITVRFTKSDIERMNEVVGKLELKTKSELIRMLLATIHERLFRISSR